ncbi:MAG: helix-turn-helix domain-containing protein [Actinobacteria bacterium]|nr:helix-turn-helix domain-containing protein [Actinomycetota bacterium]
MAAEGLPDLLTVEEAAALLRISRTKAYALTQEWRASGGRSGLPVIDLGDTLRVPRRALERMLGVELTGPLPVRQASRIPVSTGSGEREETSSRRREPDAPTGSVGTGAGSNVTPLRRKRRPGSDQASLFESPAGPGR